MKTRFLIFLSLCSIFVTSYAQQQFPHAEELGDVHWYRNIDQAISQAKAQDKAIFMLFQEVPGCATCRNYGQHVMTHPLIVEAIEDLFIPLAIFNNKKGSDAEVLAYYREPSWNNPVVRIIDEQKRNLVNRVSGNYSRLGVVQAMIAALEAQQKAIPKYVELMREEFAAEHKTQTAYYSMYCFWSGEKQLGGLEGVVASEPGFMQGKEVVKVEFDPQIISQKELDAEAQQASCKPITSPTSFRMDQEPKYYLAQTAYRFLPLMPIQATKANNLVGNRQSPQSILSPRQQKMYTFIEKNQQFSWDNQIQQELDIAWEEVNQMIATHN